MISKKGKKVFVAMSGGVDSSVAAWLLKEQGYDVVGATMRLWAIDSSAAVSTSLVSPVSAPLVSSVSATSLVSSVSATSLTPRAMPPSTAAGSPAATISLSEAAEAATSVTPSASSPVEDARRVAKCLGIPFYVMDFQRNFKEQVIDRFTAEYLNGRTPNPCVICNKLIKWGTFLEECLKAGADYVASGHYARVIRLDSGRYTIRNSVSKEKDQTYVLFGLSQEQLSRTLMPVGEYNKDEIRAFAEKAGLPVAHKKDSQDICFIPDGDYASFILRQTGTLGKKGNFIDRNGAILGKHNGMAGFTIGQRKGLGIAVGYPVYVQKIDGSTGDIILGSDKELYSDILYADNIQFMGVERFSEDETYQAKIRYSHKAEACHIQTINIETGDNATYDNKARDIAAYDNKARDILGGNIDITTNNDDGGDDDDDENRGKAVRSLIKVIFDRPVRAATPGQAIVFYKEDWIAGGGIITGTEVY